MKRDEQNCNSNGGHFFSKQRIFKNLKNVVGSLCTISPGQNRQTFLMIH